MGSIQDVNAELKLNVAIIGGGIAGLATGLALQRKGHTCTVFEASAQLSEFGAGIQICANGSRILYSWGLAHEFLKVVNQSEISSIRRYSDDSVLGEIGNNPMSEWEYGFPWWQIYRPDLQDVLAKAAVKEGVRLECGRAVREVVADGGEVVFADGSRFVADLVVAADGE